MLDWRGFRAGRRRAWEGMSRGWDLGERGELMVGMVRSEGLDMFWWEVSDLKMTREREGEAGGDLICLSGERVPADR